MNPNNKALPACAPGARRGASCSAAVAAAVLTVHLALPAHAAGAGSANLQVSATVLPYLRVRIGDAPAELVVTPQDVERGYVDVAGAMHIAVTTNMRAGPEFALTATSQVERAEVSAAGHTVLVRPGQPGMLGLPRQRPGATAVYLLSFRIFLPSPMLPGSYPWPVDITAFPGGNGAP